VVSTEHAQLISLSCPHCGGRKIESSDDAVFFFCKSCGAVLEARGGELTFLPSLWEKVEHDLPEAAVYIPFWVFRTDVSVEQDRLQELSLEYPADFMVPASIPPQRPVSIVRLADKVTRESGVRQYSTSKHDLNAELGKYSRKDAAEAVELIFLSIERELFSRYPGTKYEVGPRYRNLCFLTWEKSRLDLFHVPDEHILLQETSFEEEVQKEERIDDFFTLLSKELTRKRRHPLL
jgi:hypothetical protein